MGGSTRLTFKSDPVNTEIHQNEPTWLRMEGRVTHPELGGGVRVAGRQILTSVTTTAGDGQLFVALGATLNNTDSIFLSPDTLNGRLALQARTYDRYCFRKVKLTYIPRVPTSQAGSFALGYVSDSKFPTPSFATVASMSPAMQTSFYGSPKSMIIVDDMITPKYFYTTLDPTSDASLRQTVQGTIVGFPDAVGIGATSMGTIWIDYLIDLYQPTMDQGFTLRLTPEESDLLIARRKAVATASTVSVVAPSSDVASEIGSLQLRIQQLKTGNLNL